MLDATESNAGHVTRFQPMGFQYIWSNSTRELTICCSLGGLVSGRDRQLTRDVIQSSSSSSITEANESLLEPSIVIVYTGLECLPSRPSLQSLLVLRFTWLLNPPVNSIIRRYSRISLPNVALNVYQFVDIVLRVAALSDRSRMFCSSLS